MQTQKGVDSWRQDKMCINLVKTNFVNTNENIINKMLDIRIQQLAVEKKQDEIIQFLEEIGLIQFPNCWKLPETPLGVTAKMYIRYNAIEIETDSKNEFCDWNGENEISIGFSDPDWKEIIINFLQESIKKCTYCEL